MKKSKQYRYKNHDIHVVNGYPAICTNGKCTVYVHRLVAEEMLGRELKPEEVVHHDDGDRSNYNRENLMVFKTKSDHVRYHKCGAALICDDGTYVCNDMIKYIIRSSTNICPICGGEKTSDADLCLECRKMHNDEYIQGTDKLKPTADELQELLKTNSKEKIGRMYGVSGNSVAKWAKKYNLK